MSPEEEVVFLEEIRNTFGELGQQMLAQDADVLLHKAAAKLPMPLSEALKKLKEART